MSRKIRAAVCEQIESRRLLNGGIRDLSFGTNGRVTAASLANNRFSTMGQLADDRIVTGGYPKFARLTSGGQLDSTYGVDGYSVSNTTGTSSVIAIGRDGSCYILSQGVDSYVTVIRMTPEGRRDLTFGGGVGSVNYMTGWSQFNPSFMRVLSDDSLLFGSNFGGLARMQRSGEVTSLGRNVPGPVRDLIEMPDGDLLLAYNHVEVVGGVNSPARPAVVRINLDGTVDSSFARTIITDPPAQGVNTLTLSHQSNGRIILTSNWSSDVGLMAIQPSGQRDLTWGNAGVLTFDFAEANELIIETIISQDDSITFALTGIVAPSGINTADVMIVHLNADGERDALFGVDGVVRHNVNGTDKALGLLAQADGKLVLLYQPSLNGGELIRFSAPVASSPISVSADGQLQVVGTSQGDMISVSEIGSEYVVSFNGAEARVTGTLVSSLLIGGGGGDDRVTITLQSDIPVTVNGGSGIDALHVLQLGSAGVSQLLPQSRTGTLALTGSLQPLSHTQIESLDMGSAAPFLSAARFEMETRLAMQLEFNLDIGTSLSAADLVLRNLDTGTIRSIAERDLSVTAGVSGGSLVTLSLPLSLENAHWLLTLAPHSFTSTGGASSSIEHRVQFDYSQGDTNGNGKTEFSDVLVLTQNYGLSVPLRSQGDVNYDGVVDFSDLLAMAQSFGLPNSLPGVFTKAGSVRTVRSTKFKSHSDVLN